MASLNEILNQDSQKNAGKKTLSLSEIMGETPVKKEEESGILKNVVDLTKNVIKDTLSEGSEFIKTGAQSIKETIQAPAEERKQTILDVGKDLMSGGKAFALGLWDILDIQIPKTITSLATAYLDNARFGIGIGLPSGSFGQMGFTAEPKTIKEAREKAAKWTDDLSAVYTTQQQERIEQLGIKEDTSIFDPRNFGYKLASGAGSMGLAVGISLLTKNPTLAAGALGVLEGSDTYNTARQKLKEQNPEMTKDEIDRKALIAATVDTAGITLLENVGLDFLFRSYGKGALYKASMNSITETIQETSQTLWSNLVSRYGYDKTQNLMEGVAETIILTMPIGFFGGGLLEGRSDLQLLTEQLPDEMVKKVASSLDVSEDQAKEVIKAAIPAINEQVTQTPALIQSEEARGEVEEGLASGKSPNQIAVELSGKLGAQQATALVTSVIEAQGTEAVTPTPTKPKTALDDTQKALSDITKKIDDTVLDKTPADIQTDFENAQKEFETSITQIKQDIATIKERVTAAPDRSAEKAKAKEALIKAQNKLKEEEKKFNESITSQAGSFRQFLSDYITKTFSLTLDKKGIDDIVDNIVVQTTEPTAIVSNINVSLKNIIGREIQRAGAKTKLTQEISKMTAEELDTERIRLVNKRLTEDLTTEENAKLEQIIARKISEQEKPKTQKEKVKEVVKKKGKATIKEIAKETGILEPNIRRILGVGAKEGTFERVADGVYRITVGDQEMAVIIPADAREALPKLVEEGFKADMVFLDIPYDTPAVKGGNRGVKYNLISVEDFSGVLDNVKKILRTEDAPVIHMYSQAKSGLKAMEKYNNLFPEKGFTPIARGEYTKLQKDGVTVVRNMRGQTMEPEGILVFNQSGKVEKEIKDLKFKLVRPKGYQTEKPAEMLKAIIEMTTKEGDVILDPFAGSGVTAKEAVKAKRKVVAIEKEKGQAKKIAEEVTEITKSETDLSLMNEAYARNLGKYERYQTISNSEKAQGAYFNAIKEGKTFDEAYTLAETAAADELKDIDTEGDKKDNEGDEDTGDRDNKGEVSEPTQDSGDKPRGSGEDTSVVGTSRRGRTKKPSERSGEPGKRPKARLTNEEISSVISSITSVENGEVKLTGEITEEVLEAANQYKSGGITKEGRGILDEYYTNSQIVDMVKSLLDFPATPIKVLEPSVGTGNFLYAIPEIGNHTVITHEINETTARIAKIFHNNAKVLTTSFEETFIDDRGNLKTDWKNDYDLVIGNPPYGEHRGKYLGLGEEKGITKYEDYFVKRGLDLLKEGGTLAMVLPSSFMDRKIEFKNATVEIAFRLPEGVFEGTSVGTDIVVLRKKLGHTDKIGNYFKNNPSNILGIIEERTNRFGKKETFVSGTIEDAINLFYEKNNESEAIKILKELGVEQTKDNVDDAETAIDEAGKKAKSLIKEATKKGKETITKKIVKQGVKKGEVVSLLSQFEGEFSDEEIAAWKDTQPDGSLTNPEKHKNLANYMEGKWYLDFMYAQGDIYSKLSQLEIDKKTIGQAQYLKQKEKLEAVIPKAEKIENLKLSPNIGFVKDMEIGIDEDEKPITLRSSFLKWLNDLPRQAFGDSSAWEVREYVNNEQVRGSDKNRNDLIRERRKIMADSLFAKFLKDGLTDEQKKKLVDIYNSTFNFFHLPNYEKVPLFAETFTTFGDSKFSLRPVQKHGIGRLLANGVGVLAHDVGFGKTMSGIVALAEVMSRGWAKKPVVVVPNENVYRQWVDTIQELIPNAKFNLLGNLGASYKGDISSLKIEDGSITLLTYEGFKRLGFKDDTYNTMSSKFAYIADDLKTHKSERDTEKAKARAEETGGKMKRGTRADIFFEDLGFDHLTFDEVHNANHIVSKVKLEKGQASEFNRFSLRPSDLGIKTWLASQYIQSNNNGRNVTLLSATPFTNHPLEYYSILSLVADNSLRRMGLLNVNDFFGTFMEAEHEYEFKADGTYQKKTDIRTFRNFRQFRKLIDSYVDIKEGDAEGIVRPDRVQQTYEIPQNNFGLEMESRAQQIFKENEKEAGQGAKVLRAITELRKIAFSPYASKFAPDIAPTEYKKFIEDSPKLKTLMGLLAQNKKDNSGAGQIVYVDQVGVEFLPMMKEYMVKVLGYKVNEVEIISGAVSKTKRLEIQDKYNKGDVKIVLGSEAIKEGMNLQSNTSDLYILSLPWNFTQLRQVIGRAWRQGNKWKNVRINNLFIQDSIDVFLSQKLENKQKRYEASIKSGDQEVDIGDVSFDEMKFELIKDPETRAKIELQAEKERIGQEITQSKAELAFATRKLEKINDISDEISRTEGYLQKEKDRYEEAQKKGEEYDKYWVDRYSEDLVRQRKQLNEELQKLKEKDIDVDSLMKTREAGEKKVAELETKQKALDDNYEQRLKEIKSSMPERKIFSDDIITAFVADRAEQNKTFYKEREQEKDEIIKPVEKVKEIKNASGTKVLKTKKTVKAEREEKVEVAPKKASKTKNVAMLQILTDEKLSVQEKVDKLLEKKQEGKKYKDVGDRVAGSKKENAVIQAVIENGDNEILRKLASELGNETVLAQLNKQKLLEDMEVPTAEVERAKGTPAWIANYKINVFNKINNIPKTENKQRRYGGINVKEAVIEDFIVNYPEALRTFVADLSAIASYEDYLTFSKKYDLYLTKMRVEATFEDKIRLNSRKERMSDENSYGYIKDPVERAEELKNIDDQIKNGVLVEIPIDVLGNTFKNSLSIRNVRKDGRFVGENYWDTPVSVQYLEAQEILKSENGIYSYYDNYYEKQKYKAIPLYWGERYDEKYRGGNAYNSYEEALLEFKTEIKERGLSEKDVLEKTKKYAEGLIKNFNENYEVFLPKVEVGKAVQIKNAEKNVKELEKAVIYNESELAKNPKSAEYWKEKVEKSKENLVKAKEFLARLKGETEAIKHGNFEEIAEYDVKTTRFQANFVKAENLMKVYGFKSAQLGNYVDDASAKEHITQTMASMEDMSKVIGIDFAKMTKDMGLSIAFGARGGGGSAVAHFEPAHKIINITKRRGDGSFGHEFMHALDSIIGGKTRRGKWSGGNGFGYYSYNAGDFESMKLTGALLNGVEVDTEVTYKPGDSLNEIYTDLIISLRNGDNGNKPLSLEEAVAEIKRRSELPRGAEGQIEKYSVEYYNQAIADVYRKEFKGVIKKKTNNFYKKSAEYGGGKTSYWTRKEELWARAFQAYLEDKLTEAGIKNNYLTRSTVGISVYPQGAERVAYNKMFDALFDKFKSQYPLPEKLNEVRFKTTGAIEPSYTLTDAGNYISDLKKRLGIDFDIVFVDSILAGKSSLLNPFNKEIFENARIYGATAGNTIALVKDMAAYTAEHETVHLTLRNMDRIGIFKRNGLNRGNVMQAQADKMGVILTEKNDVQVEEQLAIDFEKYVVESKKSQGILNKFFKLLKEVLTKFARAIGVTKGDLVSDYFDILLEGKAKEDEMVRLENMGVIEAFMEEGTLNFDKVEIPFDISPIVEDLDNVRFKLIDEGDKRMANFKKSFNELEKKKKELEGKLTEWKNSLEENMKIAAENAKIIDEVDIDTKELAKYTKRTPPVGELTEKGVEKIDSLQFENKEEAQEAVTEYLKRKTELLETRNQLRKLRRDISEAKKAGKDTARNLRDVERRLKLRKALLEKNDYYIGRGVEKGKKVQMKMIYKRGVVLKSMQRFIGLSDERAKKLIGSIGKQRIYLMSEKQFNDFMVEFVNRGIDIVNTLDERTAVGGLLAEMQFKGEDNIRKALGLPVLSKMTQQQAEKFNRVLSQYQIGDVFLSQRMLETIHRTAWGDVRTLRELNEKIFKTTGISLQDMKDLKISDTDILKNGLELSTKNPLLAWLVDRRIKADIQATSEYVAFEEELNAMVNKARSSRNKGLIGKIRMYLDIAPIDPIVFDYIENENKPEFAEKNKMTTEEIELAQFLIARMFEPARQYMMTEYGMKDRQNYITHLRRGFAEAFMSAVRKDGIKGITTGIKQAVMELISSQTEDEAQFNILSGKTGEIVAFEKWFKFAMPRSGKLQPTKNVAKATLAYAKAYFKKLAIDEMVPEALAMLKIQQETQGFTEKGLPKNAQNEEFIKEFINDAKGRKIDVLKFIKQGSSLDNAIKLGISWTALRLLGGRISLQLASFVGEAVTTVLGTNFAEKGRGVLRTFDFRKTGDINEAYKFFTGRNPLIELLDPNKGAGARIKEVLFLIFSLGRFLNSRFYLRAKMTEQEWRQGFIEDDRLLDVIKEMNKWKNGQFYVKSLAGNTTVGASFSQFISWAFPMLTTTMVDVGVLVKKAKSGQFAQKEAVELGKIISWAGVFWTLAMFIKMLTDDDDEIASDFQTTKGERDMWFYLTRELNTIIGAFNVLANLDKVNPLLNDLLRWIEAVKQLIALEKYKQDGRDYSIGQLKGVVGIKRLVTPILIKDFLDTGENINTKMNLIQEAVESGEFDPKSIAERVFADEWNNVKGERTEEEQEAYREKKLGELNVLYNVKKDYADSKMAEIALGTDKNTEKIEKMVEYAKEVGVDKAYKELKELKENRNLCADPKKRTGCLISGQLFDDFRKAKKLLD